MTQQEHLRSQIRQQADKIAELNLEVEGGTKRQKDLRSKLLEQNSEIAQSRAVVLAMRDNTDEKATEILARLRLGESVEELCKLLEGRVEI